HPANLTPQTPGVQSAISAPREPPLGSRPSATPRPWLPVLPSRPMSDPARRFTIGLDLGGTDLQAARVLADGRLECFGKRPSRAAESAEGPLEAIAGAAAAPAHGP